MAQDYYINFDALNKVSNKHPTEWVSFLREEFISAIAKCNNSLTPGLDKIFWKHLKYIVKDKSCLGKVINIANACFELGHWPSHFKISTSIIIPKTQQGVLQLS